MLHDQAGRSSDQTSSGLNALERRTLAAAIDAAIIIACCAALLVSFGPMSTGRSPAVWVTAMVVLGVVCVVEVLTGKTLGKAALKLAVVREDGSKPPIQTFAMRGLIRLSPVPIFLLSLLANSQSTFVLIAGSAITLAFCFAPTAYLPMLRQGRTMLEQITRTAVVLKGTKPREPGRIQL